MHGTQKYSLGLVLLFQATVIPSLLGVDRFYTKQSSAGMLMLFGSLFIFFLPITILITFFSILSIISTIFSGRTENVFLYPGVEFYPPCIFDFFLAFLVIFLIIAAVITLIYLYI